MGHVRELIRSFYYLFNNGRVVALARPTPLQGYKWIIDTKAGMAYQNGLYEPEITALICQHLEPDGVFFDLGSHVGYFGLLANAVAPVGAVYSFEPNKANWAFSQRVKAINQLKNWAIVNAGVGERTETLAFKAGAGTSTGQIVTEGGEPMAVLSLDEYVATHHITRLDLLKMDVEGYGGHVIRGGLSALLSMKPVLIMELHRGTEEAQVAADLLGGAYQFFDLSGQFIQDITAKQYNHVVARPMQAKN
jgi:FkbM family methyltransferase